MKKTLRHIALILSLAILAATGAGCSRARQEAKAKGEEARAKWAREMQDTLKATEENLEATGARLRALEEETERLLPEFELVKHPRHVEGYYILRSHAKSYPLASTGLAARLTMGEQLELVAALSGGTFSAIRAVCGDESATSGTVPHDQAMNYRAAGLNTVAFSGAAADSVAAFIAANADRSVTLQYLEGGRVSGTLQLPPATRAMVEKTYRLSATQAETRLLQKQILLDNHRLEALRKRL